MLDLLKIQVEKNGPSTMDTFKVTCFQELHQALSRYRKDNRWMFRGHSNPEWQLVPKAGRTPFSDSNDERMFRAWQRRSVEFINPRPSNEWEWLSIAQHNGLATRFLDWTYQPLVATFFAVSTYHEGDAHLYCLKADRIYEKTDISPFSATTLAKYKPHTVASRIVRQGGLFTIHPTPTTPLPNAKSSKDTLELIVIDSEFRLELPFILSHYGINHSSIFPDLDGLSKHINWHSENMNYWVASSGNNDGI